MYNGLLYGSVLSRSNCSYIIALHPQKGAQVAQIQHFCFYHLKSPPHIFQKKEMSIFVRYEPHPEKFWLSTSVFVSCKYFSENSFIFLSDILSRAAICVRTLDFPSGSESVVCAVPIEYHNI